MPRSAPRIRAAGLKLIEIHREDIESLPELMGLLRNAPQRFIVFCDDLSFEAEDTTYKALKTMLEGGIEGRPDNVIFYATSNRRHLMARDMVETSARPRSIPARRSRRRSRYRTGSACGSDFTAAARTNTSTWSRAMSPVTGLRLRTPNCAMKRSNGRRRAARAPAAWLGNTSRTWRDGSAYE